MPVQMDRINPKGVNGVIKADTLPGATADVQIAAGFALGDIVDVRGYKATTQTIAATVVIAAGQTLICDPATTFVPSTTSVDMFSIKSTGRLKGATVSLTSSSYNAKVFKFDDTYGSAAENTMLEDFTISALANSSGFGVYLGSTSSAQTVSFVSVRHGRILGTGHAVYLTSASNGWVNGNHFTDIEVSSAPLAGTVGFTLSSTAVNAAVDGNLFSNCSYQANGSPCIAISAPSASGATAFNLFLGMSVWDGGAVSFTGITHQNFVFGNINGTYTSTNSDNYLIDVFQSRFTLGQIVLPLGLISGNNRPLMGFKANGVDTLALAQVAPSNVVSVGDATVDLFLTGTAFHTNGSGTFNAGGAVAMFGAAVNSGAGTVTLGSTHATTVGAAGGATALPATPLGYIIANVDGTQVKIPYYNN